MRSKRRLITAVLALLVLNCTGAWVQGQSGRNRASGAANTSKPKSDPKSPASDSENEEPLNTTEPLNETIEGDVVRVDTTLVTIPVSVRDRDGKYAPDLTRQDFQIFEDGIQQRIAYFATVDQPFTVALVLDTSGSTELSLDNMQSAAIAFVGQLNPEDRVTVIAFDDKIKVLTEPTSDREALSRAIRRTRSGGSTRLFDAVDFVIKDALKGASGRKAVVLFTDGVDTASRKGTYESTLRLAEESESLIYPVSYRTFNRFGTGSPTIRMPGGRGGVILTPPFPGGSIPGVGGGPYDPDSRRADTYLQELALRSGGRFYRGDSLTNITQAFEWIADELRRQYSLGFYPKRQGMAGQRRKIKVRVRRPNLIALSRDSYVYSQPSPNKKEPDQKQPLSDDAKRSPLAAIP